jgi:hypothetical protein
MKRARHRREATPVAHMILSKRMADHKPHDMLCELVDNAFDAEAKRVWIELGRRSITVGDDGTGMEDVDDAVRFGKGTRVGRRSGVLGRYGVGMTDALCKLGPRAEVVTLRGGQLRKLRVDWEECLRNDHFPYLADPKAQPGREITLFEGLGVPSGTRVRIHGQPPALHLDKLRRVLTERYTPGIWGGREILVRREGQDWSAIEDMDPGPLADVIEYNSAVDGLPYHVYGGLMTRRSVVYNRTFIGYAYRFVEDTTELFKGVSTAHLQVFLGEGWRECLGTHKNRLESKREELFEDIRSRAKDWLVAAERKAEALQLNSLALELEEYLVRMSEPKGADVVAPATRSVGARRRAGGARERSRETAGSPGEERSTKPSRGIQIAWDAALRQLGELRVTDDGEITAVLNPDDPRIRGLRERRDCPGLVHIISGYVAQYAALGEAEARQVLRPGIVRAADPGLRAHELYAYYYDRVDQPAVAHGDEER